MWIRLKRICKSQPKLFKQMETTWLGPGANDGSVPGADAEVGPVNLWLHFLFSQVNVSLNERLVTPSLNTYLY